MTFLTDVLASGVRLAAPVAAAALGETYSERAGVINIGLEGFMLSGAFGAVYVSGRSGNAWVGLAAGVAVGAALALAYGLITISLRANQIVAGIAINLIALGATSFLLKTILSSRGATEVPGFGPVPVPGLRSIPLIGRVLFEQTVPVYLLYGFALLAGVLLTRTRWGLEITATGENPVAAAAHGVGVNKVRYQAVAVAGALAGFGGALLALSELRFFVDNMTQGRGFVALAAVIFGNWRPGLVIMGAAVFGVADALQLRLQATSFSIAPEAMAMLPYVATLVLLAGAMGRARMPRFLARAYAPEG